MGGGDASGVDRGGGTGIRARQRHLLERARALLENDDARPPGSLSYEHVARISNCLDAWISTGEHPSRLGVEQATALSGRLVAERGGGGEGGR